MAAANVDHADRAGRHRGHGRPRRSGVKVDPGRHRGQATGYKKTFPSSGTKREKGDPDCPLRQQRSFRIPLTNLDQHDGTTGPSLQPDWSFSASPVTFTKKIFFFIERGNFGWRGGWMEGSPSHRWRLEIESGGYSRPGYSQLGERGQVEPDK